MDLLHYGPGRPPHKTTLKHMGKMLEAIHQEPGIPSAKLARMLGISSFRCAVLGKRLAARGLIQITSQDRSLRYSPVA